MRHAQSVTVAAALVLVEVVPASQRILEAAKKNYKLETISGLGEEPYFRSNKNLYAELYVRRASTC